MEHRFDLNLSHVLPSAAAALDVPGFNDDLGLGRRSFVVVCLIDGLGATSIEAHPELFDALDPARGGSIEAAFPTTTPTGLASLGTGMTAGRHGIVGASFWLPDEEQVLSPLHWGRRPTPSAVQPESTVFERVQRTGVRAVTIAPRAYSNSGLTHAVLRGSEYLPAEDAAQRAAHLRSIMAASERALIYVYWADLDRAAHEFGSTSGQWRQAAAEVNRLLGDLRAELRADATLVVTADHGIVDCHERIWVEDFPALTAGVRLWAGEPRMRHLYVDDDAPEIARRWQWELGDRVEVLLRQQAIDRGLFGDVDPLLTDRIGDVLVISRGRSIVASRTFDDRVSNLIGHHGGLSDDERRIPALLLDG